MSRGPGRVQRAIAQCFRDNPDRAFTTADLVAVCFPDEERESKHEVSVLRAVRDVLERSRDDWHMTRYSGGTWVFYNAASLPSRTDGNSKNYRKIKR